MGSATPLVDVDCGPGRSVVDYGGFGGGNRRGEGDVRNQRRGHTAGHEFAKGCHISGGVDGGGERGGGDRGCGEQVDGERIDGGQGNNERGGGEKGVGGGRAGGK